MVGIGRVYFVLRYGGEKKERRKGGPDKINSPGFIALII